MDRTMLGQLKRLHRLRMVFFVSGVVGPIAGGIVVAFNNWPYAARLWIYAGGFLILVSAWISQRMKCPMCGRQLASSSPWAPAAPEYCPECGVFLDQEQSEVQRQNTIK